MGPQTYIDTLPGSRGWTGARLPLAVSNSCNMAALAEPEIAADGTKVFDLRFTAGETDLVDAGPSDTWGLNGAYLGPTLRAARGDRVRVDVTNGVDEPTTLHWHGMHLPAAMDGGPHQLIEPGATWSPSWTSTSRPPPSGTTRTCTARPPSTSTGRRRHVPDRRRDPPQARSARRPTASTTSR